MAFYYDAVSEVTHKPLWIGNKENMLKDNLADKQQHINLIKITPILGELQTWSVRQKSKFSDLQHTTQCYTQEHICAQCLDSCKMLPLWRKDTLNDL